MKEGNEWDLNTQGPERDCPAGGKQSQQQGRKDCSELGQGRPALAAFAEFFEKLSYTPPKYSNLSIPPGQQVEAKKQGSVQP